MDATKADRNLDGDQKKEERSRRWPVTGILCLGMVNAYFDRVALSVAIPVMAATIDMSATQQGIALSAFFWSYAALQIPAGIAADRWGVRKPYIWSYLLWSFASAGTALTYSFGFLLVMRILLGIGEAIVTPASLRYIRIHFEEELRGKAVGLFMTGTKIGPAFGFLLAGYMIDAFSWRIMFLIMGLGGLIFLIPYLFWVPGDDPAALTRKEQEALRKEKEKADREAGKTDEEVKWATTTGKELMQSPALWGILIGTFCYMYFVYYSLTWLPSYFYHEFGMEIREMAWYPFISFGGMAIVIWLAGYASDRIIQKGYDAVAVRKSFVIAGFLLGSMQTLAAFIENETIMITLVIVSICCLGMVTANYWAITQTLIPGGQIATIAGVQNTAANVAGVVAPVLTGLLIDWTGSFQAPIQMVGFWLVVGVVSYATLVRRKYAPVRRIVQKGDVE